MDALQKELAASYPLLHIHMVGINWFGLESANGEMVKDTSLPWLQDLDANRDGKSDVWARWGTDHLDLLVLDGSNKPVSMANLGTNNLDVHANHVALRDSLVAAAMASQKPWQNAMRPLDVDNSGTVQPLDALIIINRINAIGTQLLPPPVTNQSPPPYYDTNGDGSLAPLDGLRIINFLNAGSLTAAGEGESWPQPLAAKSAGWNGPWLDGMLPGNRESASPQPRFTYLAMMSAGASGYNLPSAPTQLHDSHSVGAWPVWPAPTDSPHVLDGDSTAVTNRKTGGNGGRPTRAKSDLAVDEFMANRDHAAAVDRLLAGSPLSDVL